MSESNLLRRNRNIKQFTLVDSQGDSLTDDTFGSIQAVSPKSSQANSPAQTSQDTTADVVLAANASRKRFMVQNTGTTVIYLGLGATPTNTAYHIALLACVAANDGTGASYIDDTWTGSVSAISSAAGGLLVITELT